MRCKVDLDELHLAEIQMVIQELIEEGIVEEATRPDGRMGYRVINDPEGRIQDISYDEYWNEE